MKNKTKAVMLKTSVDWHEDTTVDKLTDNLVVDKNYGGVNVKYGDWVKFTNVKTGDKFIIRNIAETIDNKKIHLIFTIEFGKPLGVLKVDGTSKSEQVVFFRIGKKTGTGGGIYYYCQNVGDFKFAIIGLVDDDNEFVRID